MRWVAAIDIKEPKREFTVWDKSRLKEPGSVLMPQIKRQG